MKYQGHGVKVHVSRAEEEQMVCVLLEVIFCDELNNNNPCLD